MAKKNQKAVSDEEIIAALLQNGSMAEAAQAVGISPRTVYDRMGTSDFKAAYNAAKSDIVRTAVLQLNSSLSAAIAVVSDVMNNTENNAGTRLQAAKMILEYAAKFTDRLAAADKETANCSDSLFDYFVKV